MENVVFVDLKRYEELITDSVRFHTLSDWVDENDAYSAVEKLNNISALIEMEFSPKYDGHTIGISTSRVDDILGTDYVKRYTEFKDGAKAND